MHDTALAIFAKYPEEGMVKTRLADGEIPGFGQLSLAQCAALYRAFLRDYVARFERETFALKAFFCVKPGEGYEAFAKEYGSEQLEMMEQPSFEGKEAADLGQAMSFTIRALLDKGFKKVIILGSDLPHFSTIMLEETKLLLEFVSLVIGDDGGGCYIVAAIEPPEIFEKGKIQWSEGRDFEMIQELQQTQRGTLGVLRRKISDIDCPEDLTALIERLKRKARLRMRVPHTTALLREWGVLPPE